MVLPRHRPACCRQSAEPCSAGTIFETTARAQSGEFNARLANNLQDLRDSEGLNFFEVDLDASLKQAISDPGPLGIENMTDGCTPTLREVVFEGNCALTGTGFEITLAEKFLFIEGVRPNRNIHAAFADIVRGTVAPVPLTAGLPLMLAGIGVFACGERRKQKRTA